MKSAADENAAVDATPGGADSLEDLPTDDPSPIDAEALRRFHEETSSEELTQYLLDSLDGE